MGNQKTWGTWGGFSGEFGGVIGTLGIMVGFPTYLFWVYHACDYYQCNLGGLIFDFITSKVSIYELYYHVPMPTSKAWITWASFVILQAILMTFLPGKFQKKIHSNIKI